MQNRDGYLRVIVRATSLQKRSLITAAEHRGDRTYISSDPFLREWLTREL